MSALGSAEAEPGKRRRLRTTAKIALCCFLAVVLGTLGLALFLQLRLAGHLGRVDNVFSGLSDRPSRPTDGSAAKAVNILVLTIDHSRSPVTGDAVAAPRWLAGARHVDSALLLHFDGNRRAASAVAVPLESRVDVPGRGAAELGTAMTGDQPSLAIETFEKLTDVRIDHLAVFDWSGFAKLTDDAGGVQLNVPKTVHDTARDLTWAAGRYTVDSTRALAYVGQRAGLPDPELGQTLRTQYFLRELMDDTLHTAFRKNPFALYGVLDTVSRNLAVESGWSSGNMRNLGISMRNLRSANILYLVAPVASKGSTRTPGDLRLDQATSREMWQAVRDDDVQDWAQRHPSVIVPYVVG